MNKKHPMNQSMPKLADHRREPIPQPDLQAGALPMANPIAIRVQSDTAPLTQFIARALQGAGFVVTERARRTTEACTLRHRVNPISVELERVVAMMCPFHVKVRHEPELDVDAVLCIGNPEEHELSNWRLRLRSDDPGFTSSACALFGEAGFKIRPGSEQPTFVAAPTLRYGGADDFARTMTTWMARQLGCEPAQQIKAWGEDDRDIWLDLPAPSTAGLPLRQRMPITVRADTPEVFAAIEPFLRKAGFSRVGFQHLSPADDSRLRLDPGALQLGQHPVEIADIVRALDDAGRNLGVDWARYPLEVAERGTDNGGVVIDVPLAAIRGGLLRPWSRLQPGRYEIVIHDDDREFGLELEEALRFAGFPARRQRLSEISEGFAVRCGNQVPASLREMVRGAVDRAMLRCGATDYILANFSTEGEKIEIEFAAGAYRDGRLLAELASPKRYAVKIISPTTAAAKPLAADLELQGFRRVRIEVDGDDDPTWIRYGGARPEVLEQIEATVSRHFGPIMLRRNKAWSASDHDIFIRLPKSVAAASKPAEASRDKSAEKPGGGILQKLAALINDTAPLRGSLVEVSDRAVRVGDIVLEKPAKGYRHPLAVPPARLKGFCVDQSVAETLYFTAQAIRGRYPAALEGSTAASKTWAISYLAANLGVGLHRVNLSAQSDVSELVGRFVPDVKRPGAFQFQYGPAPQAMMEGAWLVMDEANLAPSEILERCNSLLEMPYPSLTLSEFDGRHIADVHPQFRVLATWNPSLGYAGREALSPAFLDRFKTRICASPSEADYRALGECLVYGRQPEVVINGSRYRGGADQALLPELATLIGEFSRFNTALARFQAGIATMSERGELRTRGTIAFTRRSFVDVLRETRAILLAANERKPGHAVAIRAVWQAISFCHLERLDPEEERPKAIALLTACGIGANSWDLPQ